MSNVLVSHVKINSVIISKSQSFYSVSNVYDVSVSSTSLQHKKTLKNRYSKVKIIEK